MGDKSKFYLVDWVKKCSSLKEGGLRIHKLSTFNKALLDHGGDQWWACGRVLEQGRTPFQSSEFSSGGWFSCSFWYDLGCGDFPFIKRPLCRYFLLRLAVERKLQWLLIGHWRWQKWAEVGVGILSFLSCYKTGN